MDEINNDVQAMNKCCEEMTERLNKSKESTSELIGKTTALQQERKQIMLKSTMAETFLDKYQLKPNEMKVLRMSKDAIVTEVWCLKGKKITLSLAKSTFFQISAIANQVLGYCRGILKSIELSNVETFPPMLF